MCFFDKSNNSMTVNALKQLLKRRERENLSWVSQKWVFSKRICFTVSGSPQKAQDGRKNEETRLDAFEMKGLRRMLRVSWTAKKTVRPWCGQPSDRGRLKIRSDQIR